MLETLFAFAMGLLASFGFIDVPKSPQTPATYESSAKSTETSPDLPQAQEDGEGPTDNINGYPVVGG